MLAIKHTGTALNNQIVRCQVLGEIGTCHQVDLQRFAYSPAQQAGQFDSSDIFGKGSVRTGLGYEHARCGSEPSNNRCACRIVMNIALIGRKKNGVRGEQALLRLLLVNGFKNLLIGDDQLRCARKGLQCGGQLIGGTAHGKASPVEQFAQGLYLRKDEPSFGCLYILWHDQ